MEAIIADLPIPMLLVCPCCGARHIDDGEWAERLHHTHACQSCGMCWRPAVCTTVGVRFLPGFKNEPACTCVRVGGAHAEWCPAAQVSRKDSGAK